ncbi:ribbon-helix-helix protein, CopG family [Hydrogenimonas thermophila]|jgi:predicted DNA-binding protein|uniref:Transcriptional regulator, CopG family n=1 Tax=Hydrogenimonas thermophila TaxID=223786 RepID=A0A1I5Q9L2_9BACT|nr:ribbon-helix-helix protein, CopG family [Hydrogenimonas thermophila]WOE70853.1 ribbon-helix-helix protein, CopG family [Hydrogenimonas thermophila]WOE73371.1 ribbon-helix-helix protein, CopG family [Hydrogenimonas thermophila]SFP42959.1 transcriptional regulator, CopG family [Hydrogenimonas thermophila]
MLSVRLPKDIEQELANVARLEQTTKTEIVREAILFFLENLKEKRKNTPYTLGKDLFGVYDGDSDLSSNYKQKLDEILNEKHNHN